MSSRGKKSGKGNSDDSNSKKEKARARAHAAHLRRWADPVYRERKKAENRAFYAANREELAAKQRHRSATDPHLPEKRRWWNYGLSPEAYDAILARQHGACGACKRSDVKLCVDHDHATGKVRGLLCGDCNKGVGLFHDNPDYTAGATEYLKRWPADGLDAGRRRKHDGNGDGSRSKRRRWASPPPSPPPSRKSRKRGARRARGISKSTKKPR